MAETWSAHGVAGGSSPDRPVLEVEFCGERVQVPHDTPFRMGSDADLDLDVGTSLPAQLLELRREGSLWFLEQLDDGAAIDLRDGAGGWFAALRTGTAVPLVFDRHVLRIAARGTYELDLFLSDPVFDRCHDSPPAAAAERRSPADGAPPADGQAGPADDGHVHGSTDRPADDRLAHLALTDEQRLLLTVLAAPVLRRGEAALSEIPSSVEAAEQLGWAVTKFNRKLDTVCARLAAAGIGGLHGGSGRPALNRRTRLVQIVVASGLVDLSAVSDLAGAGSDGSSVRPVAPG